MSNLTCVKRLVHLTNLQSLKKKKKTGNGEILLHKGSRFWPLPTNFCGIVLLRLATLLANLSSTKALSDPVWLKSSLCSFWLLSSFITGKQDREVRFRVKVNYCPVKCYELQLLFLRAQSGLSDTRSTWPINALWVHARVHVPRMCFNMISFFCDG